jgi:hypothetical protein
LSSSSTAAAAIQPLVIAKSEQMEITHQRIVHAINGNVEGAN